MSMSLNLSNVKKLGSVGQFQLQDSTNDISHYLSCLHVDYDDNDVPTIYDIPCSSIIEFRGDTIDITLPRHLMNSLIDRAMTDVDENTLLHHVCRLYTSNIARSNRYKYDVLGYIAFMFDKPSELRKLTDVINGVDAVYEDAFRDDLKELKRLSDISEYDIE